MAVTIVMSMKIQVTKFGSMEYSTFYIYFCCETGTDFSSDRNCGFASAMLEFFEIASELWFAIIAVDILFSLTNPFSTTKDRFVYVCFMCC